MMHMYFHLVCVSRCHLFRQVEALEDTCHDQLQKSAICIFNEYARMYCVYLVMSICILPVYQLYCNYGYLCSCPFLLFSILTLISIIVSILFLFSITPFFLSITHSSAYGSFFIIFKCLLRVLCCHDYVYVFVNVIIIILCLSTKFVYIHTN